MHTDDIDPRTGLTVAVLSVTLFFGFMFIMAGMKGETLSGIPLIAIGMSICIPALAIMFAAKKTQGFRTCLLRCKDPEKSGEEVRRKSTVVVIAPLGEHVCGRTETGMLAPDTSSEDNDAPVDVVVYYGFSLQEELNILLPGHFPLPRPFARNTFPAACPGLYRRDPVPTRLPCLHSACWKPLLLASNTHGRPLQKKTQQWPKQTNTTLSELARQKCQGTQGWQNRLGGWEPK
uniref:Transmembrane protein 215 n=1 Tax=Eptatretus burgeri TaxID=7764 RepID=A0A8C4R5X2_EPTBU